MHVTVLLYDCIIHSYCILYMCVCGKHRDYPFWAIICKPHKIYEINKSNQLNLDKFDIGHCQTKVKVTARI